MDSLLKNANESLLNVLFYSYIFPDHLGNDSGFISVGKNLSTCIPTYLQHLSTSLPTYLSGQKQQGLRGYVAAQDHYLFHCYHAKPLKHEGQEFVVPKGNLYGIL